ncbi:MAG TPA: sulfite exporter TauE/SafE family protein [Chthoniobacteraceae bacterium]|jgi:hypothetical protein|nr:sulfite exporter TauE/SafE family protein [Chthoniobacteraceae bacterium]
MTIDLTASAAFTAGLLTSLHCAGMCGPLTCAMFGQCARRESLALAASYQAARLVSYSALGLILGAVGPSASSLFSDARFVPWAFALVFVAFAFGLEKRLPTPGFGARLFGKIRFARGPGGGALLGLATPFLPCGPLYLVLGVALMSGSALAGARLMAAFGLGTLPLYWLAQTQWLRLQAILPPLRLQWAMRGFAILSAGLLIWRGLAGGTPAHPSCPFCR